jgi:hypothetical protein
MTQPKNYGVNALVRRGGTRGMIDRVLGAEDFTVPNKQYPGAADMRLGKRGRSNAAGSDDGRGTWGCSEIPISSLPLPHLHRGLNVADDRLAAFVHDDPFDTNNLYGTGLRAGRCTRNQRAVCAMTSN